MDHLRRPLALITGCLLCIVCVALGEERPEPIQVYILIGQSNMQGKGRAEHIKNLAQDPEHQERLGRWWRDGEFVERDDVFIFHGDRRGPLTVGYGARDHLIGPELGFGAVVGDATDAPVALIKCAWGGRSLAKDFLPPGAGGPGETYTETLEQIRAALDNLSAAAPDAEARGHELKGLVWFQGWNDVVGKGNPDYTEQLAQWIRDMRKDLKAPNLPVVIGELGQGGTDPSEKHLEFRRRQKAVAEMNEFRDTVAYVPTGEHIQPRTLEVYEVWQECSNAARKAQRDLKDDPEAAKAAGIEAWKPWNDSYKAEWESRLGGDRGYHYYGSGYTFYRIGESFGESMLELNE